MPLINLQKRMFDLHSVSPEEINSFSGLRVCSHDTETRRVRNVYPILHHNLMKKIRVNSGQPDESGAAHEVSFEEKKPYGGPH